MKSSFVKPVFYLVAISLAGKLLALIRDINIASVFGVTSASDVFFYASTFLLLITTIISQSINTTLIPVLARIKIREGDIAKTMLLNNIMNITILVAVLVSFFMVALTFSPTAVSFLTPGFDAFQRDKFALMIQIGVPSIIFFSIASVNRGYLQSEGRYIETGLSELCMASVGIVFILYFRDDLGLEILIFAIVLASILQILVQFVGFFGTTYKYRLYVNIRDNDLKVIAALMVPVLISTGISDVSKLVDQALGSTLSPGGLSALAFGAKINGLIVGVFIVSLVTIVFPMLSRSAASGNSEELKKILRYSINSVVMLTLPATFAILVLSDRIVAVLFEGGQFDTNATLITSEALFFYSFGLVASGLRLILIKVFYSLQDTKTPVKYAIFTSVLNIVLNFLLIGPLQHKGIALATSISSSVLVVFLIFSLTKRIGSLYSSSMMDSILKIVFASFLMFGVLFVSHGFLFDNEQILLDDKITLLVFAMLGFLSYSIFLVLLRVEEFIWIIRLLRRKVNILFS